jgi:hypothetical protein
MMLGQKRKERYRIGVSVGLANTLDCCLDGERRRAEGILVAIETDRIRGTGGKPMPKSISADASHVSISRCW